MAAAAKATKAKAAKRVGNGHRNDGAEKLARASDGKFNTAQVRMLKALSAERKPITRLQLKTAVDHWPNRKGYHLSWIKALRELSPKFVKAEIRTPVSGDDDRSLNVYSITAAGREAIKAAEKEAVKIAKLSA